MVKSSVKTRGRLDWAWDSKDHVMLTSKYLKIYQMAMSSRLKQDRDLSIITGVKLTIMAVDAGMFSDLVVGS